MFLLKLYNFFFYKYSGDVDNEDDEEESELAQKVKKVRIKLKDKLSPSDMFGSSETTTHKKHGHSNSMQIMPHTTMN